MTTTYWNYRQVRLHQGDALATLRTLETASFACVVTSPPYNLGHNHERVKNHRRWQGAYQGFEDKLEHDEYVQYHRAVLEECMRVLQPEGLMWWVHRRRPHPVGQTGIDAVDLILEGFPKRDEIIWHKQGGGIFNLPHRGNKTDNCCYPANKYETVFLLAKTAEAGVTRKVALMEDVWQFRKERVRGHPATFPVGLARRCIEGTDCRGPVLDPFVGTGTTAIAAMLEGRECLGVELVEDTLAIAVDRLERSVMKRLV